jgi:putative tricarboxylic transport membrane protein
MTTHWVWIGVFLALAAGLGSSGAPGAEWARTRQVEFVIPFGPGGGADMLARTLIQAVEEDGLVKVPIVPVNRGGGERRSA